MYTLLLIPMILFFTVENLLWKKNKHSPLESLFGVAFWSVIAVAIGFCISLIWTPQPFANYTWTVFGFVTLQAMLVVFNILLWVLIMKLMPVSIAEPISMVRVFLMALFSLWIFGSPISLMQGILISSIFLSCVTVSLLQTIGKKKSTPNIVDRNHAIGLALVFVWVLTSVGINLINQHVLSPVFLGGLGVPPITHATIQTLMVFVFALIVLTCYKPQKLLPTMRIILTDKVHIGIGASGVFARICFSAILYYTAMNVGILNAFEMASTALVVIGGVVLFKERPKLVSYFFIAIIIACAVSLSLV